MHVLDFDSIFYIATFAIFVASQVNRRRDLQRVFNQEGPLLRTLSDPSLLSSRVREAMYYGIAFLVLIIGREGISLFLDRPSSSSDFRDFMLFFYMVLYLLLINRSMPLDMYVLKGGIYAPQGHTDERKIFKRTSFTDFYPWDEIKGYRWTQVGDHELVLVTDEKRIYIPVAERERELVERYLNEYIVAAN